MEEAHRPIAHRLRPLRPTMVAVVRMAVVVDIVAEAGVVVDTTVVGAEVAPMAEAAGVVDTPRPAVDMVVTAKKE